jgi:hypothetical protein
VSFLNRVVEVLKAREHRLDVFGCRVQRVEGEFLYAVNGIIFHKGSTMFGHLFFDYFVARKPHLPSWTELVGFCYTTKGIVE